MSDELSPYTLAAIAGGFGIAGTLLGTWITYRLAIKLTDSQAAHARALAERHAMIVARDKLHAAFAPALGQIYLMQNHGSTHDRPQASPFVKENLLNYAEAIEAFRPYVAAKDAEAYQKAWDKYHYFAKDSIHSTAADWTEEHPSGETLKQNIDAILTFAKAE